MARKLFGLILAVLLCSWASPCQEQEATRADVLRKTEEYRARLQDLLVLYEEHARAAARLCNQRRQLYVDGLISSEDLDSSRRALDDARRKVEKTSRQVAESDQLVAEIRLAEELKELEEKRREEARETVIFYSGTTLLSDTWLTRIESFFESQFGTALPLSAVGQTALHTSMGFAHQDAVDVALHPDSDEGQLLMTYLRDAGISFIAFRHALSGAATGAHIHVGKPSVRISENRLPATTSEKSDARLF